MSQVWVFGYGSLMWDNSEFRPQRKVMATLVGAHRSYNKKSIESRGTRNRPGLVLGTEPSGQMQGIALLIDQSYVPALDRREGTSGYTKIATPSQGLKIIDAENQLLSPCIVYISNPSHSSYVGNLNLEQRAQIAINAERGIRGTSVNYIKETLEKSLSLGINDSVLKEMLEEVQRLQEQESHPHTHLLSRAITDVEVYDSPAQYGNRYPIRNNDLIAGLPKEIRDALGLTGQWERNETVVVHHGIYKLKVKAVQTDSRLASSGTCKADNPANHCWMTPDVRQKLGVNELSQDEWVHRLNYPAFKKKYAPVKLTKD